jgi:hypothetical protein
MQKLVFEAEWMERIFDFNSFLVNIALKKKKKKKKKIYK